MRIFLSLLVIALALMIPVTPMDVAKLQPVETVAVYVENGRVVLETDTEDRGVGATALDALADMKAKALSVIYLDTAEYLLVQDGAEEQALQLCPLLGDCVKVGKYLQGEVKQQAAYYEIHGKLPKLKHWEQSQ